MAILAYHLRPVIGLSDTIKEFRTALDAMRKEGRATRREVKNLGSRVADIERANRLHAKGPSRTLRTVGSGNRRGNPGTRKS